MNDTRSEVLDEEQEDDERELCTLPSPMVQFDEWTDVARAGGCSPRTIARLRNGADLPTSA